MGNDNNNGNDYIPQGMQQAQGNNVVQPQVVYDIDGIPHIEYVKYQQKVVQQPQPMQQAPTPNDQQTQMVKEVVRNPMPMELDPGLSLGGMTGVNQTVQQSQIFQQAQNIVNVDNSNTQQLYTETQQITNTTQANIPASDFDMGQVSAMPANDFANAGESPIQGQANIPTNNNEGGSPQMNLTNIQIPSDSELSIQQSQQNIGMEQQLQPQMQQVQQPIQQMQQPQMQGQQQMQQPQMQGQQQLMQNLNMPPQSQGIDPNIVVQLQSHGITDPNMIMQIAMQAQGQMPQQMQVSQTPEPDLSQMSKKERKAYEKQKKKEEEERKKAERKAAKEAKKNGQEPLKQEKDMKIGDGSLKEKIIGLPLWQKILGGVGCFIVFIILISIIKGILGGGKSNDTFYSILKETMNYQKGSFTYTFQVASAPVGKLTADDIVTNSETTENGENSEEGGEATEGEETTEGSEESTEETTEEKQRKTLTAQTQDWNEHTTEASNYWKYPNYTVTVKGQILSADPVTSKYDIIIRKEKYEDLFTSIFCVENNYYVDLQQMKTWLENSNDVYLMSLASDIPDSSRYVLADKSSLKFVSKYCENGEEENASVLGFQNEFLKWQSMIKLLTSNMESTFGSTGLGENNGHPTLELNSQNADMHKMLKGVATNSESLFDGFNNTMSSLGVYDEAQLKQANREKDNFISAFSNMLLNLSNTTNEELNMSIVGVGTKYTSESGVTGTESNLKITYNYDGTSYAIILDTAMSSSTDNEIKAPEGTSVEIDKFDDQLIVDKKMFGVVDYLNFTDVDLSKQLEKTPANIVKKSLIDFVDYINELELLDYKASINNVNMIIAKYKDISELSEEDPSYDNAPILNKLVTDFLQNMSNVTSYNEATGTVEVAEEKEELEKYTAVDYQASETLTLNAKVNEAESTNRLVVIDLTINNTGIDAVQINAADFSLKTMIGSIYQGNNKTLLENSELSDLSIVEESKLANPNEPATLKLYFALNGDQEYSELQYGETVLGAVINY